MAVNLIGRTVNGQFRVDAQLNSQGKDSVYEVRNLMDDKPLVMKVLPTTYSDNPSIYNEVVRKANALRKLSHPNIIPFYGLFRAEDFSFTLEKYIDGSSLDHLLREREGGKQLPFQDALSMMKAVSAALDYAHSSGIVHGDLKPENVMVSNEGKITLTGFKIAPPIVRTTIQPDPETAANRTSETIRVENLAHYADIFAAGVLLFEILSGERLFRILGGEQKNKSSLLAEHMRQAQLSVPQTNPRYAVPEIYDELAAVILKALKQNPADSYHSVKDFYFALCKAARVFDSEIPNQLWAKIPVTGAAANRNLFNFQIAPGTAAIFGAILSVLLIGGVLFFSGFLNSQQSSKVLPGYAYVEDGEVTYQVPGGQPKLLQKGASFSTGAGALIAVGGNLTTLILPGDYRLKIMGNPITVLELVQETSNQSTNNIVELHQGSLFLLASDKVDKNRLVYIQTVSGRASLTGSIMGNRYDSSTQVFSVDCVKGECLLEADDTVNLNSGQRSQVDAGGIPIPPSPINLGLYHEYNLSFIPMEYLAQNATPYSMPQDTPTPHPTIAFTPTRIPPTWTPTPTPAPKTGYGH